MAYLLKLNDGKYIVVSDDSFTRLVTKEKEIMCYAGCGRMINFLEVKDWKYLGEISKFIEAEGEAIWNLIRLVTK